MRRGSAPLEMIIFVILAIAVVAIGLFLLNRTQSDTTAKLDDARSCSGVLGSLSGREGKCLSSCSGETEPGYHLQQIGKGKTWGCQEQQYCCLVIPKSDNLVTGVELANALCRNVPEGGWVYGFTKSQADIANCNPVPASLELSKSMKLVVLYRPKKTDFECKIFVGEKIGHYVIYKDGMYQLPNPLTNDCQKGMDSNGLVAFYLGDEEEINNYFKISNPTVELTLYATSGTKKLTVTHRVT